MRIVTISLILSILLNDTISSSSSTDHVEELNRVLRERGEEIGYTTRESTRDIYVDTRNDEREGPVDIGRDRLSSERPGIVERNGSLDNSGTARVNTRDKSAKSSYAVGSVTANNVIYQGIGGTAVGTVYQGTGGTAVGTVYQGTGNMVTNQMTVGTYSKRSKDRNYGYRGKGTGTGT